MLSAKKWDSVKFATYKKYNLFYGVEKGFTWWSGYYRHLTHYHLDYTIVIERLIPREKYILDKDLIINILTNIENQCFSKNLKRNKLNKLC